MEPDRAVGENLYGGIDLDVLWFSAFALIGTLISLGVSLSVNCFSQRAVSSPHPNRLLGGLMAVQVVGVLVMGVSPFLALALGGLWVREAARNLAYPIQVAWMNRHLESDSRATVLSMSSQVDALGQVTGGPALGAVGSRWGLTAALAGSAAILAPAVFFFLWLRPPTAVEENAVAEQTTVNE